MMSYRDRKLLRPLSVVLLLPVFMLVTSDAETCGLTDHMSAMQVFLETNSRTPHGNQQPHHASGSLPQVLTLLQAAGQVVDQATALAVAKFGANADQLVGSEEEEFVGAKNSQSTNFGRNVGSAVFVGIAVALIVACYAGQKRGDSDSEDDDEVEHRNFEPLDEDAYRLTVVLLVRDGQFLANNSGLSMLRVTRILGHLGLLAATIVIQIVLLNQIKFLVTPQAVTTIRTAYDEYELKMCGGVENHTTLTINGKHRCKPEYFQPDIFMGLDDELKTDVCNIPFSQLRFFKLVLLIWSLTCIGQMKMCIETFATIMWATPTCESMVHAVISVEEAEHHEQGHSHLGADDAMQEAFGRDISKNEEQGAEKVITALTAPMKAIIFLLVLLPWFIISCNLLAEGSRWLASTNDFGDLILNAVGLEFVLLLKDLVYHTIVTERNKRELRNTFVHPIVKKETAGYLVFMGGFIWGALAVMWVYAYIFHIQTVLPEYKWDVHASCTRWLKSLKVKPNITALREAGLGSF